jgi:16S rRNA (guanine527-N7)-methyltransferase
VISEESAKSALAVPRETLDVLQHFVDVLIRENERQNLISAASIPQIWSRHVLDSAQLLRFQPNPDTTWLDLGTGAGLPGLVIAALRPGPVTLVEARRLRVEFLRRAADLMGLSGRTTIIGAKVEAAPSSTFAVISARAFAPLPKLLALGERFAAPETVWVLPKGKNAQTELEAAESLWQGDFRLEPSLTDADAKIIVARDVRRKGRGRGRG